MFPILYAPEETRFLSNGLGRLADCLQCTVTEERNGIYECEFKYPITGRMYQQIQEGCIVGVIHDDRHDIQPFDIYARSAPIDGVVTFYAHHISYRLGNVILRPFTASSCAGAMAGISANSANKNPFQFWTDKAVSANFAVSVPSSVKAVLGGQKGSILDVYGKADYQWDKWTVRLYQNRGTHSGVTIRYGKNLLDITHRIDASGAYSAAAPYWADGNGDVVTLPEMILFSDSALPPRLAPWTDENDTEITDESDNVVEFQYDVISPVPMDLSQSFNEKPTVAQLRAEAKRRLNQSEAWLPDENIEVDFAALWQTTEYEGVAALQRVSLCDTVSVYYPELGVVATEQKVIKTVYNVLLERYDKIELGNATTSFADSITARVDNALVDVPTKSMMQSAINNATDLLSGGLGGHVVFNMDADGKPQEILIMDTDDAMTAVNVLRINKNGIGFSNTGYAGKYKSAWTIDGNFVADFITAGELNGALIKAGTLIADKITAGKLSSQNGRVYFDLDNNELHCDRMISTDTGYASIKNTIADISRKRTSIAGNTWSNGLQVYNQEYETERITLSPGIGTGKAEIIAGVYDSSSSGADGKAMGLAMRAMVKTGIDPTNAKYVDGYAEIGIQSDGCIKLYGAATASQINNAAKLILYPIYYEQTGSDWSGYNSKAVLWGKTVDLGSQVNVTGSFSVTGTKRRVVDTDHYGTRSLYCYETPSPLFGDVGEGVIGEDGLCYIWLDPVFAETINTAQYQVFLQRYGNGDCYIAGRHSGYFVVAGTPGLPFGWEIKAKQADFDQFRLEKDMGQVDGNQPDYGEQAAAYYTNLMEGRMAV